jgi:hypothetical protein
MRKFLILLLIGQRADGRRELDARGSWGVKQV